MHPIGIGEDRFRKSNGVFHTSGFDWNGQFHEQVRANDVLNRSNFKISFAKLKGMSPNEWKEKFARHVPDAMQ